MEHCNICFIVVFGDVSAIVCNHIRKEIKPLNNFYTSSVTQTKLRGENMPMTTIELFHLKYLCRKCGIDTQEIDHSLTYYENKRHLLEIARNRGLQLEFWEEELVEFAFAYEDREIDHLITNIRAIAFSERKTLKLTKWLVGKLILQMDDVLWSRYGENFFGKLARQIGCKGYSADQLRKCVHFAELPESFALQLIEDDNITWENIRRGNEFGIQFFPIVEEIVWDGCPEVKRHLAAIQQTYISKGRGACKDCRYYKLCSRLVKQLAELSQSTLR